MVDTDVVDGGNSAAGETAAPARTGPGGEPPVAIVHGDFLALQVFKLARLPDCLKGVLEFHHLPSRVGPTDLDRRLPPEVMRRVALVWSQATGGTEDTRKLLLEHLGAQAQVVRFPPITGTALWPFGGPDPRCVPEPLYPRGRYPFMDHVAARLAGLDLPDDYLFERYMELAAQHLPDMQARLEVDIARWRANDANADIHLADHLVGSFRAIRLFYAPNIAGGELACHLALQLLLKSVAGVWCEPARLVADYQVASRGYLGDWWTQPPVNPLVAEALGLEWWSPDARYIWHNNRWDFRRYILNYIRWAPWAK